MAVKKEYTARATLVVHGHGKFMQGVSEKTKKPYAFQEVSFAYEHPWFTGDRCDTATIQGADLAAVGCPDGAAVGDVFEAFIMVDGYGNTKVVGLVGRA